jgi:hypothetical protein
MSEIEITVSPTSPYLMIVQRKGEYIGILTWDADANKWFAYKKDGKQPVGGHSIREQAANILDRATTVPHWETLTGSQFARILVDEKGDAYGYMVRTHTYHDWTCIKWEDAMLEGDNASDEFHAMQYFISGE